MRRHLIGALQEKMNTSDGVWKISDLILRSAQQVAESLQSEKTLLYYNLK